VLVLLTIDTQMIAGTCSKTEMEKRKGLQNMLYDRFRDSTCLYDMDEQATTCHMYVQGELGGRRYASICLHRC